MSQNTEYQKMSNETLTHTMFGIERDLIQARFQHSMGSLENTSSLRILRRRIAQIKSEARSREIAEGLAKDSLIRLHRKTYDASSVPTGADVSETDEDGGGFLQGIVDKLTNKE